MEAAKAARHSNGFLARRLGCRSGSRSRRLRKRHHRCHGSLEVCGGLGLCRCLGGKPGVIIFTDSTYAIAIAKADRMKKEIEDLGGTVLEYVDTPIAETSQRMPQLTTSLLQKYGAKWTHSLAINDLYYDFMGPSLASA